MAGPEVEKVQAGQPAGEMCQGPPIARIDDAAAKAKIAGFLPVFFRPYRDQCLVILHRFPLPPWQRMNRLCRILVLPVFSVAWNLARADAPASVPPPMGSGMLQMLAGLALVVVAIFASLWLLKKISVPRGAAAGLLKVVAGTAVGPRERVVLLEVGDDWLVLGVAPGRVSALHRLPRQVQGTATEEPPGPAMDFGARLRSLLERRHGQR